MLIHFPFEAALYMGLALSYQQRSYKGQYESPFLIYFLVPKDFSLPAHALYNLVADESEIS